MLWKDKGEGNTAGEEVIQKVSRILYRIALVRHHKHTIR